MRIAVVGFGGAGQAIIESFAERYGVADVYAVSDVKFADVEFFEFDDLEKLIEKLSSYDFVVLTAGLGGRGGDCLVEMLDRLDNVIGVFVAKPFSAEKSRVDKAEKQLAKLRGHVVVRELDELIERMPDASIHDAITTFDDEMADSIAEFIRDRVGGVIGGCNQSSQRCYKRNKG